MNKAILSEELDRKGIDVISYEFSQAGYVLELKLNPERAMGWEVLEQLPVVGIEVAKIRPTGEYTRKVLFIPSNSKEFNDYVIKHMRYYGLGRTKALTDLQEMIMKFGKKYTQYTLGEYLKIEK